MNKKLLTLAVGAALTSAPMFANAAVTVYGNAHVSVDMLDNGATTNGDITTLSSNSSYIGFKADEDLGGGLKALFGAEIQVGLDNNGSTSVCTGGSVTYNPTLGATASSAVTCTTTSASNMFNRNVFVGLQGGFGTVRLGNYDDVVKQVGRAVDLFYNEALGESRAVTRQQYVSSSTGALSDWDARLANSINYETPSLGGAKLTLNYGMANSNSATTASDLTAWALGLQYGAGPLYLGLAYKSADVDAGTTKETVDGYRLSASFKMLSDDALRFVGFYQSVSYPAAAPGNVFGADTDQGTYGLGASWKFGNVTLKGQYYVVDSFSEDAAGATGAALTALGIDYNFSKTTVVYLSYAAVDNDDNAAFSVIGAGHSSPNDATTGMPNLTTGVGAGNDPSGFSIGMRMAF